MRFNKIYITGFRGVGKTTLGKILSKKIKFNFIDLDQMIEEEENKTIFQIVEEHGWPYFRKLEFKYLKIIRQKRNEKKLIISLGGGVGVHDDDANTRVETIKFFESEEKSLFLNLHGDIRDILPHLKGGTRPSLNEDIELTYKKRIERYLEISDFSFFVNPSGDFNDYANSLIKILERKVKLTILLGSPISHSKSPYVHNQLYKKIGIDGDFYYSFKSLKKERLKSYILKMKESFSLRGITVTIPHKEKVYKVFDLPESKVPQYIKSCGCNTVIFGESENELAFYQTDIDGLKTIFEKYKDKIKDEVTVLGAGGVAKAVLEALRSLYLEKKLKISVISKSERREEELNKIVRVNFMPWNQDSFNQIRQSSLIINGTPIGMRGKEENLTIFPEKFLEITKKHTNFIFFDLVYTPPKTKTILMVKDLGYEAITGDELFCWQALKQFELITNRVVDFYAFKELLK